MLIESTPKALPEKEEQVFVDFSESGPLKALFEYKDYVLENGEYTEE